MEKMCGFKMKQLLVENLLTLPLIKVCVSLALHNGTCCQNKDFDCSSKEMAQDLFLEEYVNYNVGIRPPCFHGTCLQDDNAYYQLPVIYHLTSPLGQPLPEKV